MRTIVNVPAVAACFFAFAVSCAPPVGDLGNEVRGVFEILADVRHDPPLLIDDTSDGSEAKNWRRLSGREREESCAGYLAAEPSAESAGDQSLTFVQDRTKANRATVRRDRTREVPDAWICEPHGIWIIDYTADSVVIRRFAMDGNPLYRVRVDKPADLRLDEQGGFLGRVMLPTFGVDNGFLTFEWWSVKKVLRTNVNRRNISVRRILTVRQREPRLQSELEQREALTR